MKKKIVIIGSGFSSISAACYLSKSGHEVHVHEKNKCVDNKNLSLLNHDNQTNIFLSTNEKIYIIENTNDQEILL